MNGFITRALRARKVWVGRDFYQSRQVRRSRITLGNRYADWTICPDLINPDSVIYSFGVGEDISFDLLLMDRFKVQVYAFDPSPDSISWLENQDVPEGFHFNPYGLAGRDGEIIFEEPMDPGARSLRMSQAEDSGNAETEPGGMVVHKLPVHRLPTVVKKLGHDRIDILKMDIEGAEYEVIEDIISLEVPVTQVLIEFHHRFKEVGVSKTKEAIRKLNGAGYSIFHVSANGEEISFIYTGN